MEPDFRQLFSWKFDCKPADFEERVFWHCLFRHALPFAWLLGARRTFFREDFDLVREVASVHNVDELICELNRFYGRNRRDKNLFRTDFFIRISGKRVLRLYRSLSDLRQGTPEPTVKMAV